MRFYFTLIALLLFSSLYFSQAPQAFSFQSVIRNSGNQLLANQQVGIKMSILQGGATGQLVYAETHSLLTNANGLATIQIGDGTLVSGSFGNINWANGPYFIKCETDVNGGANYTISSVQQLLSVPYALFSKEVKSSVSATGDTLYIGTQPYIIPAISSANNTNNQSGSMIHTCGADSVHNLNLNYGNLTDQEGNVYKTIAIGNQVWMAENLKTSIFRNGESIPNVTDNAQWAGLSTSAWCYYNNNSQFECPYGKLYNWYTATDSRNVCPTGWHVPTDDEWSILINHLDLNANGGDNFFNSAGGKMKSRGVHYWLSPNQQATNVSGFSGLPGALRDAAAEFYNNLFQGLWWSSSEYLPPIAWCRSLSYHTGACYRLTNNDTYGLSIRCLRD
jgi:uncharacterized protein (TIGR02145 family)